jgi:hypothetical protein
VKLFNSRFGISLVFHFHKAEATLTPGIAIGGEGN